MPSSKKRKKNTGVKATAYVLSAILALGGGGTGGFFLYNETHPDRAASAVADEADASSELLSSDTLTDAVQTAEADIQPSNAVVVSVDRPLAQVTVEQDFKVSQAKVNDSLSKLTINATSMEKDLKIKIEDETKKLVGGQNFVVYLEKTDEKPTTTSNKEVVSDVPANGVKTPGSSLAVQKAAAAGVGGEDSWVPLAGADVSSVHTRTSGQTSDDSLTGKAYTDDDGDGIIYIKNLESGNYSVKLASASGFYTADASGIFNVKDKIEYKVVDVKDQIKKEKDIDTSKEEGGKNAATTDEATVTDSSQLNLKDGATVASIKRSEVVLPKASVGSTPSSANLEASITTLKTASVNIARNLMSKVATGDAGADPNANPPADPATPPAAGHAVSDATKFGNDDTKHWNICDVEGCTAENAAEHTFGEWTVVTEATTEAEGSKERVCSVCQYKQTQKIDKLQPAAPVVTTETATVSIPSTAALYASALDGVGSVSIPVTKTGNLVSGITWASSDTKVVNVSGDANSAKLTAVGAGNAKVTATVTYVSAQAADGTKTTATKNLECTVTVKALSTSEQLKDKNGSTVYTDKELKNPATQADAEKYDTFYQSQIASSEGIDLSSHNGTVNWSQVANSGIHFAIIRAGYRGYGSGVLVEDTQFRANIAGAAKAGMKIGIYFYSQAVTEAEAVEEASMVVSLVKGYGISYPIFIDSEYANTSHSGRADGLSKDQRTAVTKAFCSTIQNAGYKAGIYASKSWYSEHLNMSQLSNYYIWVAQYNTSCSYGGKYQMWQYTSKGSCPGVSGNVDKNISYMGY